MEILKRAQEITKSQSTVRRSDLAYGQRRCKQLDEATERMPEINGFTCEFCSDRGGKHIVKNDNEICWEYCSHCANIRQSFYLLQKSGLADKTFDSFKANSEWQTGLLEKTKAYSNTKNAWLFIGGQSGCGKTHLCTAAVRELIFRENVSATLFKWIEDARLLKSVANESGYISEIDRFRTVTVLYIDDLFKGGITAADLKLAYDLLDYRYRHKLRTIISSELYLDEIISKDEALGGRIKEMAGDYVLHIGRDSGKNHRL